MSLIIEEPLSLEEILPSLLRALLLHLLHAVGLALAKDLLRALVGEYLLIEVAWVLIAVGGRAVVTITAARAGSSTISWR